MKEGDKITYVRARTTATSINLSERHGTFVKDNGDGYCTVRAKNGKCEVVMTSVVRPEGQPNALAEALARRRQA